MEAEAARDWRIFDRPELRAAVASSDGRRQEVLVALDGIHCGACVARSGKLMSARGAQAEVNLATRTATLRFPSTVSLSTLLADLDAAGFAPRVLAHDDALDAQARERRRALARIGIAVICAMQVMMLAWPGYFGEVPDPGIARLLRWAQWIVATPGVLWAGWPFFANALRAVRSRTLNMDVPVALSLVIAYVASAARTLTGSGDLYFDAATMFVAVLLAGRHLEGATRAKAGERLRRLAGRRIMTARRIVQDITETIPLDQVRTGDLLEVPPGEELPADGRLLGGAELDESLLTGESRPVLRKKDDVALAGSLHLGRSPLLMRATAVGASTQLAQITRLLQGAEAGRPRVQQIADRLAGWFTGLVLLLAVAGAAFAARHGFDAALQVALAVLVASCPCALSLAVPAALAAVTSKLAANGVLVARPDRLLRLPEIDVVLFDKTGTLTLPDFRIDNVLPLGAMGAGRCLQIAAALEAGSAHPLARPFATVATPLKAHGIVATPGQGVQGVIEGRHYRLGRTWDETHGEATQAATTTIELSGPDGPLARIDLSVPVRADASQAVGDLRHRHIRTFMLTGDGRAAAEHVGKAVGIASVEFRQSPADKLERLHHLQSHGKVVLAAGDGINDAPFLAAADVSVAMPQGAALAQSKADLVLVGERLAGIGLAIDLARQARRRIRQNLAWALVYNLTILSSAMSGHLPPWLAALGMSVSSLLVVGNSLRLRVPAGTRNGGTAEGVA